MSASKMSKVKRRFDKILHGDRDKFKKISFSQCGEDIIIDTVFLLRGIKKPTYIDIGANHPEFLNNTAIFYKRGSRGINIEANPLLIGEFKKKRSEDINLNIGIGEVAGEMDFFVMADDTLSTFSKEECDRMVAVGNKLDSVHKVKVNTIKEVLEKYTNGIFPDLLTIDVEGLDFQILKTINFEHSFPKVICVEAAEYSPIGAGARRTELIDYLLGKGYYEYANTNLNAVLVKNEFWFI